MREVRVGRLDTKGVPGGLAFAALPLAMMVANCEAQFTGPYPCTTGYASCGSPGACGTNIQTDALNCGGCSNGSAEPVGMACPLGAPCVDSTCGAAAMPLTAFMIGASPSPIAANSSGIFWNDGSTIRGVPASGGAVTMVGMSAMSCGRAASFAVDDVYVYYFSFGSNCAQPGSCAGLVKAPLSGGAPTVLVPPPTGGGNQCGPLALSPDGNSLYALTSSQQGSQSTITLSQISLSGAGAGPSVLATAQSNNGSLSSRLVVTSTAAVFATQDANFNTQFEVVPVSGGPSTAITLTCPGASGAWCDMNPGGYQDFAADSNNIYVVGSSCSSCNNNGPSNSPPSGALVALPIDGRSSAVLSSFTGQPSSMALDAALGEVYWSTDVATWKAPVAGGTPIPVAGNLGKGAPTATCTGCGGGVSTNPNYLAIGPSHVYIADHQPMANQLLQVTK